MIKVSTIGLQMEVIYLFILVWFSVILFYVNLSRLSSQPLTILAPLVLLRVRWSIPLVP